MENNFKTFGQALNYYREMNHWTRQEAADAIGTTKNAYNRFEGSYEGYERPNRELVVRYARAFRVPEGEMLVSAGYLPTDEQYNDTILSGVAHWRLQQLKEMQPETISVLENMIGILYKQASEVSVLKHG